jgi:hypothetical protein
MRADCTMLPLSLCSFPCVRASATSSPYPLTVDSVSDAGCESDSRSERMSARSRGAGSKRGGEVIHRISTGCDRVHQRATRRNAALSW